MNRKDILKNLKEDGYIKRTIIGYGIDSSVLYDKSDVWLSVLKPIQITSMLDKDLIEVKSRDSSTLNGIGGKMMDTRKIIYISKK